MIYKTNDTNFRWPGLQTNKNSNELPFKHTTSQMLVGAKWPIRFVHSHKVKYCIRPKLDSRMCTTDWRTLINSYLKVTCVQDEICLENFE